MATGWTRPSTPMSSSGCRWTSGWTAGSSFAIGANNLFDVDPPGCFTCGLNNLDPTTYDVPGPFFYAQGEGHDVAARTLRRALP